VNQGENNCKLFFCCDSNKILYFDEVRGGVIVFTVPVWGFSPPVLDNWILFPVCMCWSVVHCLWTPLQTLA